MANKTNKKIAEKIFAVISIMLLMSLTFAVSLSLNAPLVSAQSDTTTVCIRRDGSCDVDVKKSDCEANFDYPSTESNIDNIDECQPSCCVFKRGSDVAGTEWVFYEGNCKYLAGQYGYEDFETRSINAVECADLEKEEPDGYCRTVTECYASNEPDCADDGGSFSLDSCPTCIPDDKTACHLGDVYNFDSCDIRGTLVDICDMNTQRCKETGKTASCVANECTLNINFTNLGYDTAHLKSREVEYFTPTEPTGNIVDVSETPELINLSNLQTACVRYQGPGERHYTYTCMNGKIIGNALDENREDICDFNAETGIAYNKTNDYEECGECNTYEEGRTSLMDLMDKLAELSGADMLSPEWWDYQTIGGSGLCDKKNVCEIDSGDCMWNEETHDCFPKLPPNSGEICAECMTTKASSPWNKCAEECCLSRGNCEYGENKINVGAAATICVFETAMGNLVSAVLGDIYEDLGDKIAGEKTNGIGIWDIIKDKIWFFDDIIDDYKTLISKANKEVITKQETVKDDKDAKKIETEETTEELKITREYLNEKVEAGEFEEMVTSQAKLHGKIRTLDEFMEDVYKNHHPDTIVELTLDSDVGSQFKTYDDWIVYFKEENIGHWTYQSDIYYWPATGNAIATQGFNLQWLAELTGKVTDINIQESLRTIPIVSSSTPKTTAETSDYYNYVRDVMPSDYDQILSDSVGTEQSYEEAMNAYFESIGSLDKYLIEKVQELAMPILISYLAGEVIKKVLSWASPQYLLKLGFCSLIGSWAFPGGTEVCMESGWVVPIILCTMQSAVQGQGARGSCVAQSAYEMPGVVPGYTNCYLCNEDDNRECTAERCYALSDSGDEGCSFDSDTGTCSPHEDLMKDCENTENTQINIEEIIDAGESGPANNRTYTISNIEYNSTEYEVEVETNKYAECRWFESKDNDWDDRIGVMEQTDLKHKFHAKMFDVSEIGKKEFEYYVRCVDGCNPTSYTPIARLILKKKDKPKILGPLVISQYPTPNMLVEGAGDGTKDVTLKAETDEESDCRYMRYTPAEGPEGMLDYLESVTASGDDDEEITATIAAKNISYDNTAMIQIPSSDEIEHKVTVTNLENSKTYAYVVLCQNNDNYISKRPTIIKFKVSEVFDIDINEPTGSLDDINPRIKVETDRDATCKYVLDDADETYAKMTLLENTGLLEHSTIIEEELSPKDYSLKVSCVDQIGQNMASETQSFTIIPDVTEPIIVRFYKNEAFYDTLFIVTDEKSACEYEREPFVFGTGTPMTNNEPLSTTHEAAWSNEIFYIVCKDRFDNIGYPTKVRPYDVVEMI